MPLLATWGQYSTYVDAQGKYRIIWQWDDGNIEFVKFPEFIAEELLQGEMDKIKRERNYGWIEKLPFNADSDKALIVSTVIQIRTHPNLTLTQWNNYLNELQWYESNCVKAFIFRLAQGLTEHYGVTLENYTEIEVLLKVRNWICTVNINILKKVVFGYFIEI